MRVDLVVRHGAGSVGGCDGQGENADGRTAPCSGPSFVPACDFDIGCGRCDRPPLRATGLCAGEQHRTAQALCRRESRLAKIQGANDRAGRAGTRLDARDRAADLAFHAADRDRGQGREAIRDGVRRLHAGKAGRRQRHAGHLHDLGAWPSDFCQMAAAARCIPQRRIVVRCRLVRRR